MIATRTHGSGRKSQVRVISAVGDRQYYLVDDFTGRPPLLVRYDRLAVAGRPLKGPPEPKEEAA